jgi:hypothetical protein
MMSCDYCNELPDNCKCEPDDDRIDGHESRIDSLERIYGDLRSDITEHMKTSSQRRTELLASMAATIAAGLARHINDVGHSSRSHRSHRSHRSLMTPRTSPGCGARCRRRLRLTAGART